MALSHGGTSSPQNKFTSMKRAVKTFCWIVVGAFLLCLAWLATERISGIRHLNAYLKTLQASGEKLDVSELEPRSRPNPTNNAALALVALSNEFRSISELSKVFPPSGRMVAPGQAIAAQHLDRWFWDKKTTNTWDGLDTLLDQHREELVALHMALGKPEYDLNFDYHGDFNQPFTKALAPTKSAATYLTTSALSEIRRGDLSAAQTHLLAAIRLGANQPNERLLITQLVRQAVVVITFNAMWSMLPEPGWTDAHLAALQQAWTTIDLENGLQVSLEIERDMQLNYFKKLANVPGKLSKELLGPDFLRPSDDDSEWEEAVLSKLKPLQQLAWHSVWKEQDMLLTLRRSQFLVEQSRTAREKGFAAIKSHVDQDEGPAFLIKDGDSESSSTGLWNRFRFPISSHISAFSDVFVRNALSAQTKQQMMCAALACHRYRLATGTWPGRLEELVPKYLAFVPRDPIGGGLLVYRPDSEKGFILYSKGANGIDDGGDPNPETSEFTFRRMDHGKDIVWPTIATPKEADEALLKTR